MGFCFSKNTHQRWLFINRKGVFVSEIKKNKKTFPGIEDGIKEFLRLVERNKNNMPRNN